MKGLKTTTIIIISIGGLLSLIPLIFYLIKFNDGLATDASVWGQFGDFIGGTINPIIGLVNLALLIAISVYVASFDSKRQFNEYRYRAYIELCLEFEKPKESSKDLKRLKDYLENYFFNNQFLFPKHSNETFNDSANELIEKISTLISIQEKLEEDFEEERFKIFPIPKSLGRDLDELIKDFPQEETEESKALKAFSASKKRLLGFIQAVMIDGDLKKFKLPSNPAEK